GRPAVAAGAELAVPTSKIPASSAATMKDPEIAPNIPAVARRLLTETPPPPWRDRSARSPPQVGGLAPEAAAGRTRRRRGGYPLRRRRPWPPRMARPPLGPR